MKVFTQLILMWIICLGLITTGCPKDSKSALEDGFSASVRVSSYGTDLTKAFTQLKRDGAIPQVVFDGVISKLEKVGIAGRKVHDALAGFVAKYPDGNVPSSEFQPIALLFNSDIYGPVIELLGTVAGLSPANQAVVSLAMTGLKLAVNTVRSLMNRHAAYLGLPKGDYYATT
jgi:hypothetical protein